LAPLTIGTKRGSVYLEQFDNDKSLKKFEVADDINLAKMLQAGLDVIAVSDRQAMETALKAAEFADYGVSPWHVDIVRQS
jgi:hypothetical protein